MRIRIRRKMTATAEGEIPSSHDVYEWSPAPDRWYTIRKENIKGIYPEGDAELTRNLFNALLQRLTATVEAKYFRDRRILEVKL